MNVFSVLKFHNSFPSTIEKHLITLSKSTVINLSFLIAIFELNGDRLSFFQFSSPLSKFNEKIDAFVQDKSKQKENTIGSANGIFTLEETIKDAFDKGFDVSNKITEKNNKV